MVPIVVKNSIAFFAWLCDGFHRDPRAACLVTRYPKSAAQGESNAMYGWTEEQRAAALNFRTAAAADANQLFVKARAMIATPAAADIGFLLRAYSQGVGTFADVSAFRVRELASQVGQACGYLPSGGSFFTKGWSLSPEAVDRFCPDVMPNLLIERSNEGLGRTDIFEWCPNEITVPTWPPGIAGSIRRPRRLPFRAYTTDDAAVYVDPQRYQVMSRDLSAAWETGSPRGLTLGCILEASTIEVDGDLVVIQDRFDFRNFCHFLYDAVTRVVHFVDRFGFHGETFVFGGIPGRYQEIMGQALSDATKVPMAKFYLPTGRFILRPTGKCTWFSDQKELHAHPAQMAHPESIKALARVAEALPSMPSNVRRLYISRADADRRRVSNEAALVSALENYGFTAIQLAKLPVDEQIALFQGAEVIVGPHGMGLTNIILGKNIGRMLELFHPDAGTDAYAVIALTSGMNYNYLLGEGVPGTNADFSVDIDRTIDLLSASHIHPHRMNFRKAANLIPASRTFHGFSTRSPEPRVIWPGVHFDRMMANQETCAHWKLDPSTNTNVGEWSRIEIVPNARYTASCWVWVPDGFSGASVSIRIDSTVNSKLVEADIQRPNAWQHVWYSTDVPDGKAHVSVALHIAGQSGAGIVSTCWQLERASMPSAYVATG